MAGLVGYASSEEDCGDEQPEVRAPTPSESGQSEPKPPQPTQDPVPKSSSLGTKPPPQPQDTSAPASVVSALPAGDRPLGPPLPPMDTLGPLDANDNDNDNDSGTNAARSSPYTTSRSLIHDLTLPSIPNFDIPPSPPGSPSPSAIATDKKFAQFLNLKKKGTHFNAKLEQSAALRNPALTDKLLQFVDISPPSTSSLPGSNGKSSPPAAAAAAQMQMQLQQYQTTLSPDVWNPAAFPDWAFRTQLRRARDKVAKEREAAKAAPGRSSVEFVSGAPSTTVLSGGVGGLSKGEKRKGAWQ